MRIMLLSLKNEVYNNIITGKKIFEHRKNFPDEDVMAYIYVSQPKKAICGIIYLSHKTNLIEWKDKYSYDSKAVERIEKQLESARYVMQIDKYIHTNEIPLEILRKDLTKFIVPQMYYYLEDTELLSYLKENIKIQDLEINNSFDSITSDMICIA